MNNNLLELAYQLTRAGEPFVLATVVWCEPPTSAKPGAQVLIQADGKMTGWIGGSCAQPVVLREALRILREGDDPYLMRLGTSDADMARNDIRIFPMSCTSGGVLDIYMEPHLPQPQLVLIGDSPVIAALSRLAEVLNFTVTQLHSAALNQVQVDERTYVLVATHGQYDEDALEQALRSPASYVGMVGSRIRAEACREYLRGSGLTVQQIERLKAPAGLDVGAVTPEEIAASILAELVLERRRTLVHPEHSEKPQVALTHFANGALIRSTNAAVAASASHSVGTQGDASASTASQSGETQGEEQAREEGVVQFPETAIDPVCGMIVEIANARQLSHYDGQDFYFCCPACKRLFERNPQEYLVRDER